MRKESGFDVIDKINLYINCDDEVASAIIILYSHIMAETLANNIALDVALDDIEPIEFLDRSVRIKVERIQV